MNNLRPTEVKMSRNKKHSVNTDVTLRRIPYPYKAMLVICSDLDETPDKKVYLEIMRFLNTIEETAMGRGVGLEVGNSIYFDMPQGQFAYWNTDDEGREMIRTLIKSGHIDCLHSYGDLATNREHAARALDELDKYGCKLEVWIDHGTAPTNFGADIMEGHGDEPDHEAYHSDLTVDYGIKYIWRGRVTSVTGQDVPVSFNGIFNPKHPLASGKTLLKEVLKRKLAQTGSAKYSMHGPNEIMSQDVLRDGRAVYEFMRCNPHWGGVSSCDQSRNIAKVLTDVMLERLIKRNGICILYTHLGKIDNPEIPFNDETVQAFCRLAAMQKNGNILVTTTSRLLKYSRAVREISFYCMREGKNLCININTKENENSLYELNESDLHGLTFYVPEVENIRLKINNKEINRFQKNLPDYTDRTSVSLVWPALEFPEI